MGSVLSALRSKKEPRGGDEDDEELESEDPRAGQLVLPTTELGSVFSTVRGRLLICGTVSTIAGLLTRRLTSALCAGILTFASLHFFLPRPVDLDEEVEKILPTYMRTAEWRNAIATVNGIVDKLHSEIDPTEHYKRWLPVNFGLLWAYHTQIRSVSQRAHKDTLLSEEYLFREEFGEQLPPAPATQSRIYPDEAGTRTERSRMPARTHRACVFATSAYGPLIAAAVGLLSPKTGKETLTSLMKEGSSDALRTLICSRTGVDPKDIVYLRPPMHVPTAAAIETESSQPAETDHKMSMCPMHFLAIDRPLKAVVLSIRGTASLSDALTDLLCQPRRVLGGYAHDGILRYAVAVLGHIGGPLKRALRENKGYRVIVTGHSLGAGVAVMIALLLNRARHVNSTGYPGVPILPSEVTVEAFAFAPPPIFSPLEVLDKELTKNIYCFANEMDVVPRLSYVSVLETLRRLKVLNELDIGPFDRVRAIANPNGEVGQRVMREVHKALAKVNAECGKSTHRRRTSTTLRLRGFLVLEIPGEVFVLARRKNITTEKKYQTRKVLLDGIGFITSRRGALNTGQDIDDTPDVESGSVSNGTIKTRQGDSKTLQNAEESCEYSVRKASREELWDILVSTNMLSDHLPLQYESAIRAVCGISDRDCESRRKSADFNGAAPSQR